MSIQHYIKEIGRGKEGARSLSREQACDLMGQILDQKITDLELGAFCLAMRIKGETAQEMAGFLDAAHARLKFFESTLMDKPVLIIPTYNGARRLPVLTPLLGILLAKEGFSVLMHGSTNDNGRISSYSVLKQLGYTAASDSFSLKPGELTFCPTQLISPPLQKLLDVRRIIGLRNSAHSLVKLLIPVKASSPITASPVLITSYTHPEYCVSMRSTLSLTKSNALILRGCEGEPVADARRSPQYTALVNGDLLFEKEAQRGSVAGINSLSQELTSSSVTNYTLQLLDGKLPIPNSIFEQIELIKQVAYASKAN